MDQPKRNLELKEETSNMAEDRCEIHGDWLRTFCMDHQQPICLVCRDSKDHMGHHFVPINEAAADGKNELRGRLTLLRTKLSKYKAEEQTCKLMSAHIKDQAHFTEGHILAEFLELNRFLRVEKTNRIAELKREAEQKSQKMKMRSYNLTLDITSLSNTIEAAEKDLEATDFTFMLNHKAITQRAECTLKDPETPSGALIDVVRHRGNLPYNVWKNMKSLITYTPFCLDPNSVRGEQLLSNDLTSLTINDKLKVVPLNPERRMNGVYGSTGFTSGIHSWDVQLGADWEVGVSSNIDENNRLSLFCEGDVVSAYTPETNDTPVKVDSLPRNVRLQFEYDQGKLSFYDLDRNKYILRITCKFIRHVFPFFNGHVKLGPQFPDINLTASYIVEN